MGKKEKILFVCRYNQSRSQIARALLEKLDKEKRYEADCAGVIEAKGSKDIKNALKKIFREYDLEYKEKKLLSRSLLENFDRIIIVADDVPKSLFDPENEKGTKVEKWSVKDGHKYGNITKKKRLEKVYQDIENKVGKFLKN